MATEDDADGIRPVALDRRDVETELEARSSPGDPCDPVAEAVAGQALAVGRGGQRDARVRMQVVDVAGVDEPMHGGIDRRGRATASEQAVVERRDHLVLAVDARVDVDEGAQPVEPEDGQTGLGERAEVAAGALDPQQLDVSPGDRVGRATPSRTCCHQRSSCCAGRRPAVRRDRSATSVRVDVSGG